MNEKAKAYLVLSVRDLHEMLQSATMNATLKGHVKGSARRNHTVVFHLTTTIDSKDETQINSHSFWPECERIAAGK